MLAGRRKRPFGEPRIVISNIGEDKSFADDLNLQQGIVSSRVALLLRSAEIKPLLDRFVLNLRALLLLLLSFSFFFLRADLRGSVKVLVCV